MRNTKRIIKNLVLFILLIIITFSIVFENNDITDIFKALSNVKMEYIIIGILFMCMYIVCDALNIYRGVRVLGEKTTFFKSLKYSLIGFFYSSITPAASGGQPMQIYYMHKDNISVANSTLILLINLSCMQIVTISTALVSLVLNGKYLNPAMITFFIVGVGLNASALALLLISIYSRRVTKWMINFVVKVLKLFRAKNVEEKKEKLEKELERYQQSAKAARNNRRLVIRTLLTTFVQFMFYYSISYWVYRSFGLTEHSIIKLITMQSVLYATVSGIPSPGAVGVSEGGYIELFGYIYGENMISSAMLINRGINFYLFVLISCVVVIISTLKDKKQEKNNNNEDTLIDDKDDINESNA